MIKPIETKTNNEPSLKDLIKICKIDPYAQLEKPPVALQIGFTEFNSKTYRVDACTYGNFSVIEGASKSRKTFLTSLFTGVYLSNGRGRLASDIYGYRQGRKIIHFDTEQGAWHAQRVFKRVIDISGTRNDDYITFGLRSLSSKQRADFIEQILYKSEYSNNIGLIVIDGIADLMTSYNDEAQASETVQKLMKWSEELNSHIITVVHLNKYSPDAKGHLGSFLYQKAESIISLEKEENNPREVIVKHKLSRGFSFESFRFEINNDGLPQVVKEDVNDIGF